MASSKDNTAKTYRKNKNEKDSILSEKVEAGIVQPVMPDKELDFSPDYMEEYLRYLHFGDKWVHPVWLAIVSREDEEDYALPQVKKIYLKIKNPDAPISIISKRIAQNLNVRNDEVYIRCCGKTLPADASVGSLMKFWPENAPNREELLRPKTIEELTSIHPINYMIVVTYSINNSFSF